MIQIRIHHSSPLSSSFNLSPFCTLLAKELKITKDFIDISFVDPKSIQEINKRYLNHDYVTDIITFNLGSITHIEGDIYICPEEAKKNALAWKCSLEDELKRLIIHGFLHLLDYTDYTDNDKQLMKQEEDRLLTHLSQLEIQ